MDVVQFGIKLEPLFKHGFSLNTGVNVLGYSDKLTVDQILINDFDTYAIYVPLHLKYSLRLAKKFQIFGFGGAGFNALTNSDFNKFTLPTTYEYGGGIRINHIQLSVHTSWLLGDLQQIDNFGNNKIQYQKHFFTASIIF